MTVAESLWAEKTRLDHRYEVAKQRSITTMPFDARLVAIREFREVRNELAAVNLRVAASIETMEFELN